MLQVNTNEKYFYTLIITLVQNDRQKKYFGWSENGNFPDGLDHIVEYSQAMWPGEFMYLIYH